MELSEAKKFIAEHTARQQVRIAKSLKGRSYYKCRNDILFAEAANDDDSTLRKADNRAASAFYPLLVDQKTAYLFTAPPLFDAGAPETNDRIKRALGEGYAKKCKQLCVDASNAGEGWVHYWTDDAGRFRWASIEPEQIIPVWSDDLEARLLAAIRTYRQVGEEDGREYIIYEIWNDEECEAFRSPAEATVGEELYPYDIFNAVGYLTAGGAFTNVYRHELGSVPFIRFANNGDCEGDLLRVKGLIDEYDKCYNGYANDLEDVQQIILVLTGYSGTNRAEFLEDLKKNKVITIDDPESGGVSTLTIDIPVEAREKMLDMTRKAIFTQGQGVDPERTEYGNASGVALKFMYSLLELKAGVLETEFRAGFDELIRAIIRVEGLAVAEDTEIIQTWTRTAINNDTELADICVKSTGLISAETIVKNHPFVEDAEDELKAMRDGDGEQAILA